MGAALAYWLERRTPDRETRVRSSAGSVCCFLEQETLTPQKVLVIPRNRWLRLNMTEKLFTETLNHNQNKTKQSELLSIDCVIPMVAADSSALLYVVLSPLNLSIVISVQNIPFHVVNFVRQKTEVTVLSMCTGVTPVHIDNTVTSVF